MTAAELTAKVEAARRDRAAGVARPTPLTPLAVLPPAARPAACAHTGPDSGPAGWHYCEHPDTPLDADVVCACRGCGPRCPGYAPTAPAAAAVAATAHRAALPAWPGRFHWVSTAQMVRDAVALAGLLPADCAGVVGAPRSGMVAAAAIATHLHLPLYSLTHSGPVHLGAGRFGTVKRGTGPLAVVEDSSFSGNSLRRARQFMGTARAIYCAVYASERGAPACDLYARALADPHLFEWNAFNNSLVAGRPRNTVYGAGIATDLDGVLVHDGESGGPVGSPYLIARGYVLPLIATGRAERHRAATEAQLRSLGVKWARLEMLADRVPLTPEHAAAHKARHYLASGCGFFAESCPAQAEMIFRLTARPVICPAVEKVFHS